MSELYGYANIIYGADSKTIPRNINKTIIKMKDKEVKYTNVGYQNLTLKCQNKYPVDNLIIDNKYVLECKHKLMTNNLKIQLRCANKINIPTIKTSIYKNQEINVTNELIGYDSNIMNLSGDTVANKPGLYIVKISLKEPEHAWDTEYIWKDGTFEEKELEWRVIGSSQIIFTINEANTTNAVLFEIPNSIGFRIDNHTHMPFTYTLYRQETFEATMTVESEAKKPLILTNVICTGGVQYNENNQTFTFLDFDGSVTIDKIEEGE